jgi:hypothetical protein
VARRIQLPSADELFGDAPKKPAAAKAPSSRASSPAASSKKASSKKISSSPSVAKAAAKPRHTATRAYGSAAKRGTRNSSLQGDAPLQRDVPLQRGVPSREVDSARIDAVEARMASIPIDSLMDLRDGLEDILAADTVDEAAVRELLDSLGG